jgi:hypothetical protein
MAPGCDTVVMAIVMAVVTGMLPGRIPIPCTSSLCWNR